MKYLLILPFLALSFVAESQCCPYINSVEAIPSTPTSSDNIKIVTTVTTPNQGMFIYSTHSVNGNNIDIEACYYSGMLTAIQTFYDTLNIGMLPAGNYSVNLTAYESGDTICTYSDSMTSTMNFTVIENTGKVKPLQNQIGKLYPNPSKGSFTMELPKHIHATDIRIRTISGQIVHQDLFQEEMSITLDNGMYLIEFLEEGNTLGYQRLLIH